MRLSTPAVAILTCILPWVSIFNDARAGTIYSDNFTHSVSGKPNGASPDTVNTNGSTWSAATSWASGNGFCSFSDDAANVALGDAFLPFSPVAGNVYTLQVTGSVSDNNITTSNIFAIGFTPSNPGVTTRWDSSGLNPGPWMLYRPNNASGGPAAFLGPNTSSAAANQIATTTTGTHTFSIILDTTPALWTTTFKVDSTLLAGPTAYTVNPTIAVVGFGDTGTSALLSNFTLSSTPEPASLALANVSIIAWLLRRPRPYDPCQRGRLQFAALTV